LKYESNEARKYGKCGRAVPHPPALLRNNIILNELEGTSLGNANFLVGGTNPTPGVFGKECARLRRERGWAKFRIKKSV
jgi:hypothetical protein